MMKWYPQIPECVRTNSAGVDYEETTCATPWLALTHTQFELQYDPIPIRDWMRNHPQVPVMACILYGIAIVLGKRYFATRERWNWRYTLAAWNLGLSVFSTMGFFRGITKLVYNYTHYTLAENFCFDPESNCGSGSSGLWIQLFVLSKFPELFDTFFIIIHKKPLIFLHWYHHITVLLYCWHSYVTNSPTGFIFGIMNYGVHAIMYFYYFLMAIRVKPKAFKAVYITLAQISQMIVGVTVTLLSVYFLYFDKSFDRNACYLTPENNVAAFVMYGSYLFLFLQFFLRRYFWNNNRNQSATISTKTTSVTNGQVTNGKHGKVE